MKLLSQISEDAMVAAFLKAEFSSERFADDLKKVIGKFDASESILVMPDLKSNKENELRAKILGDYRGYGQNREIFTDFPDNLTWYKAELTRNEISDLRYVDYSYWNELTDHTHLVKDAVKNIRHGKTVFDVSNERFSRVADKIQQGKHDFEPMILWRKDSNSPLTILEGHLRATAFGLADDKAPEVIEVIVGLEK